MRLIIRLICLLVCWNNSLFGQQQWQHTLGADLMFTFKPSNQTIQKQSPLNPLASYNWNLYKKYKYPGIAYAYSLLYRPYHKLRFTAKLGCNIRYLEEIAPNNFQTFYSMPINLSAEYKFNTGKIRKYFVALLAGYNFKPSKHQYIDGNGGYQLGIYLLREHSERKFFMKLGYDLFQEKAKFNVKYSKLFTGGIDEIYPFQQYLHQFTFGIGRRLN